MFVLAMEDASAGNTAIALFNLAEKMKVTGLNRGFRGVQRGGHILSLISFTGLPQCLTCVKGSAQGLVCGCVRIKDSE